MATTIVPAKRLAWVRQLVNQDRVKVFLIVRAVDVLQLATPNANDLKLASKIIVDAIDIELTAQVLIAESTIGDKLDTDVEVTDNNIHYAINDADKFHVIAEAFNTAGII